MKFKYMLFVLNNIFHLSALRDNVCLNKETKQDSVVYEGYSHLANDGNRDQNFREGGCTHSYVDQLNYWWAVDLGEEYNIEQINIYNRVDCCSQRLRNFYIFVYNPDVATWSDFDKKPGQLCFFYKGQAPNVSSVTCNESHGRYLKIFKKNQQVSGNISSTDDLDALSLCEVEIFVDLNPLKGAYCRQTSKEPILSLQKNLNTATQIQCAIFCRQTNNCLGFSMSTDDNCSLFQTSKQVNNSTIVYFERC